MDKKHLVFNGNLLIIGFGSIGQGVLPLILRHVEIDTKKINIITADKRGMEVAEKYGINFILEPVTKENYLSLISKYVGKGDFILNLSVDVSSVSLIKYCKEKDILYLDTCIEPWAGTYTDPDFPMAERTNYSLRESARALRSSDDAPTAVVAHGANPGLISHMAKEAIINIAKDTGVKFSFPKNKKEWASLARDLGIKVMHVAERDTQISAIPKKRGEFVNTWSIDGFYSEGSQPSEIGWGTHEKHFPKNGKNHERGCKSAIYLEQPGFLTRVRSWTPLEGPYHGFAITHNESISLADYFTVFDEVSGNPVYRPTVHYAYHPCDGAVLSLHEVAGDNGELQKKHRLIVDEIVDGLDELGILVMGHKKNAYWYGSRLSVDQARKLIPHNSATSLQVTASVLAGFIWTLENPRRGVVDADEMDHERILEIARPYLGEVVGEYTDWTPLYKRSAEELPLFPQDVDESDPWQFKNFQVV